jgi:hypothetical protein
MSKLLDPSELAEGGPAVDATPAPAAGPGQAHRPAVVTRRTGALTAAAVLLALLAAVAVGRARSATTAVAPAAAVPAPRGWTGICLEGGGDCLRDEDYPADANRAAGPSLVSPPNERDTGADLPNPGAAAAETSPCFGGQLALAGACGEPAAPASGGGYQVSPPNEANPNDLPTAAPSGSATTDRARQQDWKVREWNTDLPSATSGVTGRTRQRFLEMNELPGAAEEVTPRKGPQ